MRQGQDNLSKELVERRAQWRAVAGEQPEDSLIRVWIPLSVSDSWALLDSVLGWEGASFAWRDGRTGLAVVASGVAAEWTASGPGRFESAREACSQWCEQIIYIGSVPKGVPLAWSGFAFDSAEPGGVWEGWPASAMVVPEVVVVSGGGLETGAVITVPVGGAKGAASRIEAAVDRLLRAAEPGPVRGIDGEPEVVGGQGDSAAWRGRVEGVQSEMRAGKVEKIVLARGVTLSPPEGARFDACATLRRMCRANPTAFVFGVVRPEGAFVGATPETLIRRTGDRIETQVLAGTAPRGATPDEDKSLGRALLASRKDQWEHALTARAIETAMAPVCEDLHIPERPRLARLPHVQHLETPVEGVLSSPLSVLALVERLHPTPAVGGSPSAPALAWLREHEGLERGWYAGPVGWLDAEGDGVFAVAIRSALIGAETAQAFVGAGLVAESDADLEWRETGMKLRTASRSLSLVVEGES